LKTAPHVLLVFSRFKDRCFAAAEPRIWNNLPASLRDKEISYTEFRRQLKHSCFKWTAALRDFCDYCAYINTFLLTYLLTFLLTYTVVIWVQVGLILRPQIRGDEIRRLLSQQFYGVNGILHATSFASLQGRESQVRRLINVLLNAEFSAKQCSKGIMKITQQLYKL